MRFLRNLLLLSLTGFASVFLVVIEVTNAFTVVVRRQSPSLNSRQQTSSPTSLHVFSSDSMNTRNRRVSVSSRTRRRKTVADRTQEEAISLMRDVVRAAVEAGPRAGPQRTLQAYRAFATTMREYLPQIMTARSTQELNQKFPQILRTLMERMGSTYVKLGQFIASSPVRT
jgi:hypothetical protein